MFWPTRIESIWFLRPSSDVANGCVAVAELPPVGVTCRLRLAPPFDGAPPFLRPRCCCCCCCCFLAGDETVATDVMASGWMVDGGGAGGWAPRSGDVVVLVGRRWGGRGSDEHDSPPDSRWPWMVGSIRPKVELSEEESMMRMMW